MQYFELICSAVTALSLSSLWIAGGIAVWKHLRLRRKQRLQP